MNLKRYVLALSVENPTLWPVNHFWRPLSVEVFQSFLQAVVTIVEKIYRALQQELHDAYYWYAFTLSYWLILIWWQIVGCFNALQRKSVPSFLLCLMTGLLLCDRRSRTEYSAVDGFEAGVERYLDDYLLGYCRPEAGTMDILLYVLDTKKQLFPSICILFTVWQAETPILPGIQLFSG